MLTLDTESLRALTEIFVKCVRRVLSHNAQEVHTAAASGQVDFEQPPGDGQLAEEAHPGGISNVSNQFGANSVG